MENSKLMKVRSNFKKELFMKYKKLVLGNEQELWIVDYYFVEKFPFNSLLLKINYGFIQ
jgi:hypothetical protein